jgi:GPH family glycoside/pentoside/hexuronide:cation symporter
MVVFIKKIANWHPKKTLIISLIVAAFGSFLLFLLGGIAFLASFPTFIIGLGYAGAVVSNPALMGDAIDNDELITGKRREAIYGGVNAIITKPALSVANSLFLIIIEGFGFVSPVLANGISLKQSQPFLALIGILVAFCIVPAIFLVLSAIVLRWFSLDGPEWRKKKKFIIELHERKEKEYLQKIKSEKA